MSSVVDIIIENFLKDVEEKGTMPWQRPYEVYNSFNYFSEKTYRGINRLLLPFGEYMTAHQINEYNKTHGTDFRFQKGIHWYPVVYFTVQKYPVSVEKIAELFPDYLSKPNGYLFTFEGYGYFKEGDVYFRQRNVLKYYSVAERQYFKDSNGNMLPSKIETGEVEVTMSDPQKVADDYIKREGVKLESTNGVPCYVPAIDLVRINPHMQNQEEYFSTLFHELGHSTGATGRLNRLKPAKKDKDGYAKEECVAEICAYLCCAECGIYDMKTSESMAYENNLAYVASWKKRVLDWKKDFIYIVSQADKAFNYIMGEEI